MLVPVYQSEIATKEIRGRLVSLQQWAVTIEREQSIQSYSQFLYPPLRRRLILGVSIQILQQLTGINSIMYYATEIFKQAGLNDQRASLLATGIKNNFSLIRPTENELA